MAQSRKRAYILSLILQCRLAALNGFCLSMFGINKEIEKLKLSEMTYHQGVIEVERLSTLRFHYNLGSNDVEEGEHDTSGVELASNGLEQRPKAPETQVFLSLFAHVQSTETAANRARRLWKSI